MRRPALLSVACLLTFLTFGCTDPLANDGIEVVSALSVAGGDAPISYWPADGDANDAVGDNDGLDQGVGYASGVSGLAFDFSSGNNVEVPDDATLNPERLTLSVWVFARTVGTAPGHHQDLVGKDGEGFARQYLLTISDQGRFRAHVGPAGAFVPGSYVDGATPVQAGRWYHVAQTYDGSTLTLYVDGRVDATTSVSGPLGPGSQPLRIGGGAPAPYPPFWFDGLVDDVRLFGEALPASQVGRLAVTKARCKKDGWRELGFRDQGQCVRFAETGKDSR